MTIAAWLESAKTQLVQVGIESPELESQVILSCALKVARTHLFAHPNSIVDVQDADQILKRRLNNEPLPYILGFREFFGRDFFVTQDVLIPRQETECLVEAVLAADFPNNTRILDLGTGSGCIGITLKLERQEWDITLSDISNDALQIAKRNSEHLNAKVNLSQCNGIPNTDFDVLVSNPPYVALNDELGESVRRYEPGIALYSGETGYEFYEQIAHTCAPISLVFLEIGKGQQEQIKKLFAQNNYHLTRETADLSGIVRVLSFNFAS